jgi:hypothetical protein
VTSANYIEYPSHRKHLKRSIVFYALACAFLAIGWQIVIVQVLYDGNWSSVFHHGYVRSLPKDGFFSTTYIFKGWGYDGQDYRLIAHDPVNERGFSNYVDNPNRRYRRILIPGLAFILGLGQDQWIDTAYIFLVLVSVFLAAYWAGQYVCYFGRHPATCLVILIIPGILSGVERSTVDVATVALTLGFAWYSLIGARWKLYVVVMLASLTRETGVILLVACILLECFHRRWRRAAILCSAGIPVLAWYSIVKMLRLRQDTLDSLAVIPFSGLWSGMVAIDSRQPQHAAFIAQLAYWFALSGILLACYLAWRHFPIQVKSREGLAILLFALMVPFTRSDLWYMAYHFGRIFAPFMILLGTQAFLLKEWRRLIPLCAAVPGTMMVTSANAFQVVQHLTHLR